MHMPPSVQAASAEKPVKEYTLKSISGPAAQHMYHVARFTGPSFDFTQLNQPARMEILLFIPLWGYVTSELF